MGRYKNPFFRFVCLISSTKCLGWEVNGASTLSPIIMEVENGGLEDDFSLLLGAIFHFHDYGRKGIPFNWILLDDCCFTDSLVQWHLRTMIVP